MAKRSRGRPGQLAPARRSAAQRPTSGPATPPAGPGKTAATSRPPSGSLTEDEEARAAALEAQILADERAAEAARRKSRDRTRGTGGLVAAGPRGESLVAAKSAQEYAYVRKDLRRITAVSSMLIGLLLALWLVLEVFGVFRI
jgi:hypothetical protein